MRLERASEATRLGMCEGGKEKGKSEKEERDTALWWICVATNGRVTRGRITWGEVCCGTRRGRPSRCLGGRVAVGQWRGILASSERDVVFSSFMCDDSYRFQYSCTVSISLLRFFFVNWGMEKRDLSGN